MDDNTAAAAPGGAHAEDKLLIARFLAGDAAAFERLFRKYQQPLFSICRRFLGNHEEAEDLVQEVFLQIYHGLAHFNGRSTFFTWAYSVTVHACLARARRTKHARRKIAEYAPVLLHAPDPLRQQMRAAVLALPERYRMVIILQYYQELSQEEIARVLGWTIGQVKINLHRARHLLREALGQQQRAGAQARDVDGIARECGGEL